MKLAIIEPAETRVSMVEAKEPWEFYPQLGLRDVDHGVVIPWHATPARIGVGIVVGEFSLFVPPEHQRYFVIGRHLYGGNAILYGFDQAGDSVDLQGLPTVVFISLAGIKEAIAAGQIDRPTMAMNDVKFWEWPDPAPFSLPNRM